MPWRAAAGMNHGSRVAFYTASYFGPPNGALEITMNFLYSFVMAARDFRWIEWNYDHATKHGCSILEIESVVRNAGQGYPRKRDTDKWLIIGRGIGGRFVEVVYLLDDDGTVFVIHAMPLTTRRRRG